MATVLTGGITTAIFIGAVGLGIASFARVLGRMRHYRYPRYRRYHVRYQRSIGEDPESLERTMELIRKKDFSGCGRRLVCELAARPLRTLGDQERDILELVGKMPPGLNKQDFSNTARINALQEYRLVRKLGEEGFDCNRGFPLCPYNATELMTVITANGS